MSTPRSRSTPMTESFPAPDGAVTRKSRPLRGRVSRRWHAARNPPRRGLPRGCQQPPARRLCSAYACSGNHSRLASQVPVDRRAHEPGALQRAPSRRRPGRTRSQMRQRAPGCAQAGRPLPNRRQAVRSPIKRQRRFPARNFRLERAQNSRRYVRQVRHDDSAAEVHARRAVARQNPTRSASFMRCALPAATRSAARDRSMASTRRPGRSSARARAIAPLRCRCPRRTRRRSRPRGPDRLRPATSVSGRGISTSRFTATLRRRNALRPVI